MNYELVQLIATLSDSNLTTCIKGYRMLEGQDIPQSIERIIIRHLDHPNIVLRSLAYRALERSGSLSSLLAVLGGIRRDETVARQRGIQAALGLVATIPIRDKDVYVLEEACDAAPEVLALLKQRLAGVPVQRAATPVETDGPDAPILEALTQAEAE